MSNTAVASRRSQSISNTSSETIVNTASANPDNTHIETQQVCFMLAGGEYGVDISLVKEIIKPVTEPTPVPQSPFFVEGVIDLRGDIIPIIDLKKRFAIKVTEDVTPTRILVIKMADIIVGFLVDSVTEVLRVRKGDVQEAPGKIVGVDTEYIWGVTKRNADKPLIMLLDIEKVLQLDTEEMRGDMMEVT